MQVRARLGPPSCRLDPLTPSIRSRSRLKIQDRRCTPPAAGMRRRQSEPLSHAAAGRVERCSRATRRTPACTAGPQGEGALGPRLAAQSPRPGPLGRSCYRARTTSSKPLIFAPRHVFDSFSSNTITINDRCIALSSRELLAGQNLSCAR